jgi:hypothetical protein
VIDLVGGLVQSVADVLPLAHDIGLPHEEVAPADEGGGTSPVLIGGGVVATLGLAGGLIWVRERSRKADESAALERDANPDGDQQRTGPTLEPGDHVRPGQEPA